jgi:hypothetical protein
VPVGPLAALVLARPPLLARRLTMSGGGSRRMRAGRPLAAAVNR